MSHGKFFKKQAFQWYRIYSIKRRPSLSAAYESKSIEERRPWVSATIIHNDAVLDKSN